MRLTENYELRYMAGEYVLIPRGDLLLNGKGPLIINEMMADILKEIKNGADTPEKLAEQMMNHYSASYDEIFPSIQNVLKQLTELTVVER